MEMRIGALLYLNLFLILLDQFRAPMNNVFNGRERPPRSMLSLKLV